MKEQVELVKEQVASFQRIEGKLEKLHDIETQKLIEMKNIASLLGQLVKADTFPSFTK